MNRCLKCGGSDIGLVDCGYTTFNPGDAICKCGNTVHVSTCGDPARASLVYAWNKNNPKPQEAVAKLDKQIAALKKEQDRIIKLFKIGKPTSGEVPHE